MDVKESNRIGDGQLTILRAMIEQEIARKGDQGSYSVRSGLLLSMIRELQDSRP